MLDSFMNKYLNLLQAFLLVLISYIIFKFHKLYSFFSEFINNQYIDVVGNFAIEYLSIFLFLSVILIIIFIILIIVFFKNNTKLKFFYILVCLFYCLTFISLIFFFTVLTQLQVNNYSENVLIAFKYYILFLLLINYVVALSFLVQIFDLNIPIFSTEKNNLDDDIEKTNVIETKNNFFENWNTYIKENKIIILIILIIIFTICGGLGFYKYETTYKVVREGKLINISGTNSKIVESYLTSRKYNGDKINNKYKYVVAVINFESAIELKDEEFVFINDDQPYFLEKSANNNFIDFGTPYKGKGKKGKDYILVYQMNKNEKIKDPKIKINDKSGRNKIIKLNLKYDDDIKVIEEYNIKEEIDLSATNLGNISLEIKSFEIAKSFMENYKYCVGGKCYYGIKNIRPLEVDLENKAILKINANIENNTGSSKNSINVAKLIESYGKIQYFAKGQEYNSYFNDITPLNIGTNYFYLLVDEGVMDSSHLELSITIRDKRYVSTLK